MTKKRAGHLDLRGEGDPATSSFVRAARPLARLGISAGIGAGILAECVEAACVLVAAETAQYGNRLNASQIAAATGLTRPRVRELLAAHTGSFVQQPVPPATRRYKSSRLQRVIDGWRSDPQFLNAIKRPRRLAIEGTRRSFRALVREHGGDVPPRAVLRGLQHINAIECTLVGAREYVKLLGGPRPSTARKLKTNPCVLITPT